MRGLRRIAAAAALHQFVDLWVRLRPTQLTDNDDAISWPLTADDNYSAASDYDIQFVGAKTDGRWNQVWKAKVENKCRFFTWLLLQCKLATVDRIIKRGGLLDPFCCLCRSQNESNTTRLHMVAHNN